jgi:hypothetical protein
MFSPRLLDGEQAEAVCNQSVSDVLVMSMNDANSIEVIVVDVQAAPLTAMPKS